MRLIDADLAVEKCNEDMEAVKDLPQRQDGILDGIMNIHECPTVEPERCSDCIANGGDWECDHMHCRKGRLPSEQPTQNERVNSNNPLDCISRQDAIDAIRAFYDEFIVYDNGKSIEDLISELPSAQPDCSDCIKHGGDWDCDHVHCHKGESAQPENQNGEWKECGTITIEGYRACLKECSKCHSVIVGYGNFCPVCGADMRKQKIQLSEGKRN